MIFSKIKGPADKAAPELTLFELQLGSVRFTRFGSSSPRTAYSILRDHAIDGPTVSSAPVPRKLIHLLRQTGDCYVAPGIEPPQLASIDASLSVVSGRVSMVPRTAQRIGSRLQRLCLVFAQHANTGHGYPFTSVGICSAPNSPYLPALPTLSYFATACIAWGLGSV
jgi:hypothetical protein